ncbi:MAG: lytic transglycosylase domain-containing protein [Clostridia bacterium]|nr:lytic transglycosylase domain-containing protein [Clostridia bacterium]
MLIISLVLVGNSQIILKMIYPLKYSEFVYKYAEKYDIDPFLVFAVIKAESGFDPGATSHKNAKGLMQITERTGKWAASKIKLKEFNVDKLYDIETNISIGCWYLNNLKKEFNGNIDLVIAAYNGGSGNVNKWLKDTNLSSSGEQLDRIPFKETDKYLKKVKRYCLMYKKLYGESY